MPADYSNIVDPYFDAMCEEQQPPSFEDDVRGLVRMACRVLRDIGPKHRYYQLFSDAIANVEAWDDNNDPQANGWVGSDGRP